MRGEKNFNYLYYKQYLVAGYCCTTCHLLSRLQQQELEWIMEKMAFFERESEKLRGAASETKVGSGADTSGGVAAEAEADQLARTFEEVEARNEKEDGEDDASSVSTEMAEEATEAVLADLAAAAEAEAAAAAAAAAVTDADKGVSAVAAAVEEQKKILYTENLTFR